MAGNVRAVEATPTPGWHPDPARRFEFRYHNGERWTADVSNHGQRYVDPNWQANAAAFNTVPYGATPYQSGPGRGLAIAAFVIGLSSLLVAWVPFVFVLAGAGAIVAFVFAVIALRRVAAGTGAGKPFAVWGVVLSLGAAGLCVPGYFFTREVWRTIDELTNPGDYQITITKCFVADGRAQADGVITNSDNETRDYSIAIGFTDGTRILERDTVHVNGVVAGAGGRFHAEAFIGRDDVECVVDSVNGFLP